MDYDKDVRIDLHTHSTASDGSLSPSDILELANQLDIKAISITDHDTVKGSEEALNAGIPDGIGFLTGVEISASPPPSFPVSGSFHILGYAFRVNDLVLNQALSNLQKARENRNPKIIERLNSLGMDISLNEILNICKNGQAGRPHVAQVMLQKGFVKSIDEAFDRYIGTDRPAYVDKERIKCEKAIEIILGAGGIPVLAHPFLYSGMNNETLKSIVASLKEMGIMGIEAYYPEHSSSETAACLAIAGHYNLLPTGGTDFHGSIKPETQLGTGQGDFSVPYDVFSRLLETADRL